MEWNKLSMADRAKYIQLGVQNGITSISSIRKAYNSYAMGGDINNTSEDTNSLHRHRPKGVLQSMLTQERLNEQQVLKEKARQLEEKRRKVHEEGVKREQEYYKKKETGELPQDTPNRDLELLQEAMNSTVDPERYKQLLQESQKEADWQQKEKVYNTRLYGTVAGAVLNGASAVAGIGSMVKYNPIMHTTNTWDKVNAGLNIVNGLYDGVTEEYGQLGTDMVGTTSPFFKGVKPLRIGKRFHFIPTKVIPDGISVLGDIYGLSSLLFTNKNQE